MVIGVVLIVGVLALVLVPILFLRGYGHDQQRLEDELHDSSVRTVSYPVPPGRDPVDLMVAASLAGYRGIEEHPGLLLIECPNPDDPDKVRHLLDKA